MADRWWSLASGLAWLAFCAAAHSVPALHFSPGDPGFLRLLALQVLSIIFSICLLCTVLLNSTRPNWPAWIRWSMFALSLSLVLACWQLNLKGMFAMSLHALALCGIAIPVGWWIGSHMERVTHLVPLGVAMSMADIFSVVQGPSKDIARRIGQYQDELGARASEAVQGLPPAEAAQAAAEVLRQTKAPFVSYLVAHLPVAGAGGTAPVLGIGDFVALAFLFRATWVHRLNPILVFFSAVGSTLAALALAQLTGLALPALPLICLGSLGSLYLLEPRLRRLDRQEIVLSVGVALLFIALITARLVTPAGK